MLCPFRKDVVDGERFLPCYEKQCMAYSEYDENLIKYTGTNGKVYEDRLGEPKIVKQCKLIEHQNNAVMRGFCV